MINFYGTRLQQLTEEMACPKNKADGGYQLMQGSIQGAGLSAPKSLLADSKLKFLQTTTKHFLVLKKSTF